MEVTGKCDIVRIVGFCINTFNIRSQEHKQQLEHSRSLIRSLRIVGIIKDGEDADASHPLLSQTISWGWPLVFKRCFSRKKEAPKKWFDTINLSYNLFYGLLGKTEINEHQTFWRQENVPENKVIFQHFLKIGSNYVFWTIILVPWALGNLFLTSMGSPWLTLPVIPLVTIRLPQSEDSGESAKAVSGMNQL